VLNRDFQQGIAHGVLYGHGSKVCPCTITLQLNTPDTPQAANAIYKAIEDVTEFIKFCGESFSSAQRPKVPC
jgi:hypothetical protein